MGARVSVTVDRPGKDVLLVLSTYEPLLWQINATKDSRLRAIIVSCNSGDASVSSQLDVPAYRANLPYAYTTENVNFQSLLAGLSKLGADRIDAFQGQYKLPPQVLVRNLNTPRAELTLAGVQPTTTTTSLTFSLTSHDFRAVRWSLNGPIDKAEARYPDAGRIALAPKGDLAFHLQKEQLIIRQTGTGKEMVATLPPSFPAMSWPMDLAYDSKRHLVSVVTLGGEGFLYRYDVRKRQWLDARSLNNIDLSAITYDAAADRYFAWSHQGELLVISGDGDAVDSIRIATVLPGYQRLYDAANGPAKRLALAANNNHVALLAISDSKVSHIWHYRLGAPAAQLTWRAPSAAPPTHSTK